jgi:3-isopropylmalate dehydrogenase
MRALIAVLPGDGIGPEVVAQGVEVLRAVGRTWRHDFEFREAPVGTCALEACGKALPEETLDLCRKADAVLFGAVGGSRRGASGQALLGLRRALGLYANLRPVRPHPDLREASPLKAERLEGVDLLVVRELIGGIYFGEKGRRGDGAFDTCAYTIGEIERVVRLAASLARTRRKRLTSVDKANVLETSRLWREVAERVVKEEFPDVTLDHLLVDAAAMRLLTHPAEFDVVVTENLFGDILTDEAAVLAGSIGMLPSASLGEGHRGLYEPIHGSAPDLAGKGIANPYGAILSAAMLLRHSLGLEREAQALEGAVDQAIRQGVLTPDLGRDASTRAAGAAVLGFL